MNLAKGISIRLPAFEKRLRPDQVKFLVIHYTGGSFARVKHIFENPDEFNGVWAHFVIDVDGTVCDLVDTLSGNTYVGAHAGLGYFIRKNELINNLNTCSIGIEIVNENGNLIPFTDQQYSTLADLIAELKALYSHIDSPSKMIGHDEIASFRGKVDPGHLFDWQRAELLCFPGVPNPIPRYRSLMPLEILDVFKQHLEFQPSKNDRSAFDAYFHLINTLMEQSMLLLNNGTPIDRLITYLKDQFAADMHS